MSADNYRICPRCNEKEETLREDYEIYSEGNTIYFEYSCYCKKCRYRYKMTHSNTFDEGGY